MTQLKELTSYLDELLKLSEFRGDCSNNGLQVEGNQEVSKAIFGVDGCSALFAAAADRDADFIFVHHGISWRSGFQYFTGNTADRMKLLFNNNISLYGAHLPLDAHPQYGHNAILADMLDLKKRRMFCEYDGNDIGVCGTINEAISLANIGEIYADRLDCDFTIYNAEESTEVQNIGIVSGGAGMDGIAGAVEAGLDCLITGEMMHEWFHGMLEYKLPVITLGHYKSETPGIIKMMELVKNKFNIECEFIDIPTGL